MGKARTPRTPRTPRKTVSLDTLSTLPDMLKPREAAEYLRLGRSSVYELMRRGEIPSVRVGRRLLVPREALRKIVDKIVDTTSSKGEEP